MDAGLGANSLRLATVGTPDEAAAYADGALEIGPVDCGGSRNG